MEQEITREQIKSITKYMYEISKFRHDMRVPARIFINETLLEDVLADRSLWQLINVSTLPAIQKYAFAMPDIHEGYGFPIGGVAALAIEENGVISPGGIGYDINCGVRLLVGEIMAAELQPQLEKLATKIFHYIPSGVGRGGKIKLTIKELDTILKDGVHRMLELGYGQERDLVFCEEQGHMKGADPKYVSEHAKMRGHDQLGTLGSGNHFLEIQKVDEIYDQEAARLFGLEQGRVTIMIHCGSRGLGHQVCTDYVRTMMPKLSEWGIELPDRELVCAPFKTTIAQEYFSAMQAASNFAWANRHLIAHKVREAWQELLGNTIPLQLVYDVSHNIGKVEKHDVDGVTKKLIVHRKGATRAFGPGRDEIPTIYRHIGQPVLIPGTMGTSSYVLIGTNESMQQAFGSCCHGAGRKMSRVKAKKMVHGATLRKQLESRGIVICSDSDPGLAEEAPLAYKNVEEVVDVVEGAQLAKKVVRLVPLAVIKGG